MGALGELEILAQSNKCLLALYDTQYGLNLMRNLSNYIGHMSKLIDRYFSDYTLFNYIHRSSADMPNLIWLSPLPVQPFFSVLQVHPLSASLLPVHSLVQSSSGSPTRPAFSRFTHSSRVLQLHPSGRLEKPFPEQSILLLVTSFKYSA